MKKPTVGATVHYVSYGTPGGEYAKQCRAAIVTEVRHDGPDLHAPVLSLAVLNPTGMFFNQDVTCSKAHDGGTWHWPEGG
ncbi:hypothetical protein ACH4MO_14080 [Streptomyces globisporus]|uniref:hypothetical protein n=1 Tax=Streptomyces globisporus TaxID=1908 RepID=UPI0037AF70C2